VTRSTSPGSTAPVGRPRSGDRQRPGATAREEILDAAAELFTSRGYAATSTRTIAEAVGIRQASLYYHFASKEEVLAEILAGTVRPSLAHATALDADPDLPPDAKLFSLAAYDTAVLCGGPWNLGALYLLPEVRGERFTPFREQRAQLRAAYVTLIRQLDRRPSSPSVSGPGTGHLLDEPADLADLVFGLVESVITIRSERDVIDVARTAEQVACGSLRLVGVPGARIDDLRRRPLPR
jgi:AcrR family transcriptional regulator